MTVSVSAIENTTKIYAARHPPPKSCLISILHQLCNSANLRATRNKYQTTRVPGTQYKMGREELEMWGKSLRSLKHHEELVQKRSRNVEGGLQNSSNYKRLYKKLNILLTVNYSYLLFTLTYLTHPLIYKMSESSKYSPYNVQMPRSCKTQFQ